jgi:hypothetical protein
MADKSGVGWTALAHIDGPFAEAKEIVGGFFLLDRSREDAIRCASECPAAGYATIEVREVGPCWEK